MLEARPGSDIVAENRFSMASDPVPSRSNFCTFCWPPTAGKTRQGGTENFQYSAKFVTHNSMICTGTNVRGLSKLALQ